LTTTTRGSEHVEDTLARDAWNNSFSTRKLKQSLVEELGVSAGFARYRQLNDQPEHDEIHCKRLGSVKEIAEQRNGVFCETAPANEPFVLPPPVVIGEGGVGPLAAHTRSMYVACLNEARVRAGSNIIEVDDFALLDYQGDELARLDDRIDLDPAILCATKEVAWIITPKGAAASLEIEEAFTLLGFRPRAFGHLMLEYLPKYVGASLSGALPRVPVLIEAGLPKAHRQALDLLLPEDTEIIELPRLATARVRRLWCASNHTYFPLYEKYNERFKWEYFAMPPARYAPIIREMARRADRLCATPTGVDRLFLAREPAWHDVTNQAAIVAAAEARGFLTIYPNRLDFTEQVRLVRHARFVVGPSGGAMYLNFFARPGTKLCMFRYTEDVIAAQLDMTGFFSEVGVDVTVFTGPLTRPHVGFPPGSDFEIDESAFCRFLDRWLQS
jgi:capsular polysaccharide biosynthesis protein